VMAADLSPVYVDEAVENYLTSGLTR
jgi:hypothetical protein